MQHTEDELYNILCTNSNSESICVLQEAYGWTHSYPSSDPVHFDYYKAADIAQQNLIAFQQLW